ncbi:MAG: hypothetical protein AB7S75_13345 [Desulfococcaceae bacterium]
MLKRFSGFFAALFAVIMGFASNAAAALDLSTVTFDLAPIETIALTMIIGLASIWVIYQVYSFVRSRR